MSDKKTKTKKAKEDKPKYSVPKCLAFVGRAVWKSQRSIFLLLFVTYSLNISLFILDTYEMPAIVSRIEQGKGILDVALMVLLCTGGYFAVNAVMSYVSGITQWPFSKYNMTMQDRITEKTAATSYPNFLNEKFKNLMNVAASSCESTNAQLVGVLNEFFGMSRYLLLFGVFLGLLGSVNIILVITIIVTSSALFFYERWAYGWGHRHRDEEGEVWRKWGYLHDNMIKLPLIKETRLFGLLGWLDGIFREVDHISHVLSIKREKFFFWRGMVDLSLNAIQYGVTFYILITTALRENMAFSTFILMFTACDRLSGMVSGFLDDLNKVRNSCIKISSYMEFLEFPEPFKFEEGEDVPKEEQYEIKLENVTYTYPGSDKKILDDLNLTLHKGEKLAMVGLNGAGKTTIVKLICGFLDPDEGRVLLNGKDIRDFNRREYYKLFSAVFQQFSIVDSTVAQIVSQEVEGFDLDKIKLCIEKAGLTKVVDELPNGLETHIGRDVYLDGVELSGGQTQRLMLARSLYHNSPILVLDEPTAALDPLAENDIYMKYNSMSENKTSLFISHRLASTRFCDRVIYIADGRVAESGTHEELIDLGGGYAKLFEIQSRYYREDGDFK